MTKMRYIIPAAALSIALLAACNKEDRFYSTPMDGDYEYVTVGIDVSTGALTPMTVDSAPATKSAQTDDIICETAFPEASISVETKATGIDDPTDATQTAIMNLWVLQYDNIGDTAKLIGNPVYIEDYTTVGNRTAKLVASTAPNTIVFLANTFDNTLPFQQNSTIAELKQRLFQTNSLGKIVSKNPNTHTVLGQNFPNDGDYYQRLNGYTEQIITEGSNISCTLAHNACRVSVNIKNNSAGTAYPVTLVSVDIENVPSCMYFFTNYTGYTSGTAVGKPFNHSQYRTYGLKDYTDVITWTAAEGTSTTTKSAKLYLTANESGVVSTNTSPKLKTLFAPTNAMSLCINGTFSDSTGTAVPIKYTFALGEDMVQNYQLVPNGDYVYNITINSKGDKTSDARVSYDSASGVDYTQTAWPLSNCYICNPPSVTTRTNSYKIPVARVDQFWGGGNYEDVDNNCLKSDRSWKVSVIWSDMPVNASNFIITDSTGVGKDDYFEVSIPGTTEMGNVVIGIKNGLSDDWLWSWHLWVTDYNPDEAKYLAQQGAFINGTDTYHVTNGVVHRYMNTDTKVHMDRSIGAMSSTKYVAYGKGMLYYQFGRKDPFPGDATYWEEGTFEQNDGFVVKTNTTSKNYIMYNETDTQPKNVPFSVTHPTTFVYSQGSYWTYDDIYNPAEINYDAGIVWQDPYSSSSGNKSVFDPSPSGWKVPVTISGVSRFSFAGGVQYINTQPVPNGGTVGYVAAGFRRGKDMIGKGQICCFWTATPENAKVAKYIFGDYTNRIGLMGYHDQSRSYGYLVCPIQE